MVLGLSWRHCASLLVHLFRTFPLLHPGIFRPVSLRLPLFRRKWIVLRGILLLLLLLWLLLLWWSSARTTLRR